ncbi:MAG: class I SAM-dependent methyltransferase [Gemmatimonadota bacterium]
MTVLVRSMDSKAFFYPESRFGGFTDSDAHVVFYTRVHALLSPDSIVLDIGCGRGRAVEDPVPVRRQLRTLKGKCRHVIGIDVDPLAAANPCVDEFRAIEPEAEHWPVEDEGVDVAVSASVLEHVSDPEHFFAECRRVIKPGGFLCLRTTNAWSYSGIAARLIPNRYHAAVIRRVYANPRGGEDVFPTVYRCNTVFKLRRALSRAGFDHCVYGYQSQPSSLGFSPFFYFWGVVHQHLAPGMVKPTLFAFARKNSPEEHP